jgi:OOP family OmpA-OmpF porin
MYRGTFNGCVLGVPFGAVLNSTPRIAARVPPRGRASTLGALLLAAFTTAVLVCWPDAAHAQAGGYFYLDRAQLSGAPEDGFMVWRPYVAKETLFYGTAALGYSHNPLRDDTVTANPSVEDDIDNPVQGQLAMYLLVGTQVARRVTAGISLPITWLTLYGDDPAGEGVGRGGIGDVHTALNDLRLDARVRLWETDNRQVTLGAGGALWAPTGSRTGFTGDGRATGYLYAAGEINFNKFFLSGNLGPQFRPARSIGGEEGALYIGSELRWAFGAYLPMRDGKVRLGGELWGTTGVEGVGPDNRNSFFALRNTTLEWLAQARFVLDPRERFYASGGFGTRLSAGYGASDFRILGSIGTYLTLFDFEGKSPPRKINIVPDVDDYDLDTDGDGYPDSIDQCPTLKEDGQPPNPTDGCPAGSDRDGDGIPDSEDQCPDQAEDKDGVQDQDGCPEDDADNDGIPDVQDKCPLEPGPRSSVAEKNGCPSLTRVGDDGQVTLLQPIEFEFGKAQIKAVSFPILDEVVTLLKARPSMRLGVYGHTDNKGTAERNLQLSKERAAACLNYLVSKGIARNRLESEGYGLTRPIADNDTDEGRARNRRVEFKILAE